MSELLPVQPPQQGLISKVLSWAGRVITALVVSWFFSLMMEWVGIAFIWPERGAEHSRLMMNTELAWFATNVQHSLLSADPVGQLNTLLQQTWQWLFADTRAILWLEKMSRRPDGDMLRGLIVYAEAAVYVTQTFVLRVFILLLTAPLFVLAALTGVIDGLVRRDIRRFGCGYESGFIYHHVKRIVLPIFFLTWIIYLSLPFSVAPWVILLPSAFLFGLSVSIATGSFKKYL